MKDHDLPPCLIFIDKEGRWFHKGAEMIHRETIRLFYEHMTLDLQERYIIEWRGDRCTVDVEDTAFVVWRVTFQEEDQNSRFILHLSDDTQEPLLPGTLCVLEDHVLYCRVKEGRFPARFHRPAYYQLAQYVIEENGAFFLPLQGQKHRITQRRGRL
jgi:hypothetical protein